MSRQAEARARQVAAVYPCAERCGRTADYRCELRQIGERRIERRAGVDVVVQPYVEVFLCESCCKARLVSADPPRLVEDLPHKRTRVAAERAAERAAMADARLGDWGRRDR